MKQKEIKNLAKKIAQQEYILKQNPPLEEKQRAEQEIMRLCASVKTVEDMLALDEAVQDLLF